MIINKTDLAPYVGADLQAMERDAKTARGTRPVVLTSVRAEGGIEPVAAWVGHHVTEWNTAQA